MCLSPKKEKGTAQLSSISSWSISNSGHLKPQVCVNLFVQASVYIKKMFFLWNVSFADLQSSPGISFLKKNLRSFQLRLYLFTLSCDSHICLCRKVCVWRFNERADLHSILYNAWSGCVSIFMYSICLYALEDKDYVFLTWEIMMIKRLGTWSSKDQPFQITQTS